MRISHLLLASLFAATVSAAPARFAQAQDFFIPNQPKGAAPPKAAPRQQVRPNPAPAPQPAAPPSSVSGVSADDGGAAPTPTAQMALPPMPDLPPLPKGASPPAAVIGVMGVPEVMRGSSAAQQIEKAIGERREKLNEDAKKEQSAWREMQQALVNDRAKLTQDQGRARERELQERITNSQRQFRERGRIIQEAAQFALAQIERTLVAVIRQVAESRGMNLVLHRQQVALNVNEFDITDQVAEQLNKVLSVVVIPPDGVAPPKLAAAADAPATPAAGPAVPAAAPKAAPASAAPK